MGEEHPPVFRHRVNLNHSQTRSTCRDVEPGRGLRLLVSHWRTNGSRIGPPAIPGTTNELTGFRRPRGWFVVSAVWSIHCESLRSEEGAAGLGLKMCHSFSSSRSTIPFPAATHLSPTDAPPTPPSDNGISVNYSGKTK